MGIDIEQVLNEFAISLANFLGVSKLDFKIGLDEESILKISEIFMSIDRFGIENSKDFCLKQFRTVLGKIDFEIIK